jgi:hypothetical protein
MNPLHSDWFRSLRQYVDSGLTDSSQVDTMFVMANEPVIRDREKVIVGNISPKSKVSGAWTDGTVDVFELSRELAIGGGGSGH